MEKLKNIKCYLLDMDGTIYLGNELIDGAKEFLEKLKEKNIRYIFLTNNSSKNKDRYVEKLNKLGIKAYREDVFSSGEATTIYLNKRKKGAKVFLLGTKVIGKPNSHIIDAIIEKYNLKKSELAMVGDRLYTDIRTGIDNGLTSILVMSGETDKKILEETIYKPDYIFNSVKELKEKIE